MSKKIIRYTVIILATSLISSCSSPVSYKRPQILANFGDFECKTKQLRKKNFSSIWDKLNAGFCLDNVYSSRIEREKEWFMKNKQFLYRSIDRAKPFLYHVIKELENRNLPYELALLPIVESGYQPYAHSPSKAAGIWQFIPPTAKEYRLTKNWWYDGRRDILSSTKAATHFLSDMHRHFKKDWLLAIASYNTGAGKVGRSMSKAKYVIGKTSFWDLNLPRETEIYVPKLLALRDIMANPKSYGIKLPKLSNQPQTGFVKIYNPIDFYTLSVLSDVNIETLYFLNPGFSAWYIMPSMQDRILLPLNKIKKFNERYKKYRTIMFKEKIHIVQKGDTLSGISKQYNVKVKALMVKNSLNSDLILVNQKLRLPIKTTVTDKNTISIGNYEHLVMDKTFHYFHTVKRYDNWYRIAKFYDVNLKSLLSWNNADKNTKLFVGNKVKIEMRSPILSINENMNLRYVVNTGDTTGVIASGFDIPREELLSLNGIKSSRYLVAGKNLVIRK